MWSGMTFGWHSLLSTSLNLKLLNPREVIAAAEAAWQARKPDLAGVEGFIRQVLGWREFIRGVYYLTCQVCATPITLGTATPLPQWYWTADTGMNCMRQCVGRTLEHGYAHHPAPDGDRDVRCAGRNLATAGRGLVSGGIRRRRRLGRVAQHCRHGPRFANGGRFTSKPYVASGAVKRMSNYCDGCRYRPDTRTGRTPVR